MSMLLLRLLPQAAELLPWLAGLATWLAARVLNMPEPLVQATGLFVFAHVEAAENRFLKSLCPIRLWRRLQTLRRKPR